MGPSLDGMTRRLGRASLLLAPAVVLALAPLAAPAVAASSAHWSRSTYTSYGADGRSFATGTADGVHVTPTTLTFGTSARRTSLGGHSYETATWTSPWTTPADAFQQAVASWDARTPSGSVIQVRMQVRMRVRDKGKREWLESR